MVDLVQSVKPLTYAAMHEGLLVPDEAREMIGRSQRGQPFQQVMLSAEARSRVELWREYTPDDDSAFWVSYRDHPGWFLGDTGGNLHYSYDGLTWTIVKRFSAAIKGVFYDGHGRTLAVGLHRRRGDLAGGTGRGRRGLDLGTLVLRSFGALRGHWDVAVQSCGLHPCLQEHPTLDRSERRAVDFGRGLPFGLLWLELFF